MYDSLGVLDVHVTKVIIPVLISDRGCLGEFALGKRCVNLCCGGIKFVQDPKLCKRFMAGFERQLLGDERGVKFAKDVFSGLVDLITELAITLHDLYVEVYVTAC